MADYGSFAVGGVTYPLLAGTARSLLEDADPALYHAARFLAAMLGIHMGARLTAQAQLEGLKLAATRKVLAFEPAPELITDVHAFPLFALYRKTEVEQEQSLSLGRNVSEWEFSYLLPTLSPRQHEVLSPILRSVGRIIKHAVRVGWDPAYEDGLKVWQLAGIQSARMLRAEYTGFRRQDEFTAYYRAVTGRIEVVERDMPLPGSFEPFGGGNLSIDAVEHDGTDINFLVAQTHPPPTLTGVAPSSGTRQGGTVVTLTGTGFRVGSSVSIRIGHTLLASPEVLDETHVRGTTVEHPASPTFIADVSVTNDDGQTARLPAAFAFTSP